MIAILLAIFLLSFSSPATSPVAALRVDGDNSTFMAEVTGEASLGYQITISCTERCAKAVSYHETTGDTPLGFFSRDQNNLIFSTWSGGSGYRVLVWSIAGKIVRKVADLSSRGRPDFMSDGQGAAIIQTYEGDGNMAPLHRVRWTFDSNRFVRSKMNGK